MKSINTRNLLPLLYDFEFYKNFSIRSNGQGVMNGQRICAGYDGGVGEGEHASQSFRIRYLAYAKRMRKF